MLTVVLIVALGAAVYLVFHWVNQSAEIEHLRFMVETLEMRLEVMQKQLDMKTNAYWDVMEAKNRLEDRMRNLRLM